MQREKTLRGALAVFILGQTALLLLAFGALLPFFFDRGAATTAGLFLELQARDYDHRRSIDPKAPLPMSSTLDAYVGAESLPGRIMEWFPAGTHRNRHLQELELASDAVEEEDFVLFFPYDLADGPRLYLIQQVSSGATGDRGVVTHLNALIALVWSAGLGALILVFLTTGWVLRRIGNAMGRLSQWARTLSAAAAEVTRPEFGFRELDEVAEQLRAAFAARTTALSREHSFLRNASHELRTPIAIVQANVALIERRLRDGGDNREAVIRIGRAADSMQRLTETLLWLSREEAGNPPSVVVPMEAMVTELLDENAYLLEGKAVEVVFEPGGVEMAAPETASRIVLGNLIRNAFQYSDGGVIAVEVRPDGFLIRNEVERGVGPRSDAREESGYGLGLMLVQKVVERMGWRAEYNATPSGREAVIRF